MANNSKSKTGIIVETQLRRARELLESTREEVAQKINVRPQDVTSWEEGQIQPNLEQLEALAKLYGREIDYFLRETPAPPEKIEFRGKPGETLGSLSKEAKIVLARFDELCRTALEFETLLNQRREVRLPGFRKTDPPAMVVQNLRAKFGVGDEPLPDLRSRLEDEGVRIFELTVPDDVFSGFAFWHAAYGPCILVNAKDSRGRKNFTLAHELAHLLYKHGSSLCYIPSKFDEPPKGLEYKANQVAIELLLPKQGVMEDFGERDLSRTPSEKKLSLMARKWGTSIQALGYRLEKLGLIERGLTDKIVESRPKYYRRPKIPTWERRLGKQFVETSTEAYRKNLISISKLAHTWQIPIRKALDRVEREKK